MGLSKGTVAIALCVILIGCETTPKNQVERTRIVCPVTLFEYTKEELAQARKELDVVHEQFGDNSIVLRMLNDYGLSRDQTRACIEHVETRAS